MSTREYELLCQQCNEEFNAKRLDAKFCSPYCRKRSHQTKAESTNLDETSEDSQVECIYFPEDNFSQT